MGLYCLSVGCSYSENGVILAVRFGAFNQILAGSGVRSCQFDGSLRRPGTFRDGVRSILTALSELSNALHARRVEN